MNEVIIPFLITADFDYDLKSKRYSFMKYKTHIYVSRISTPTVQSEKRLGTWIKMTADFGNNAVKTNLLVKIEKGHTGKTYRSLVYPMLAVARAIPGGKVLEDSPIFSETPIQYILGNEEWEYMESVMVPLTPGSVHHSNIRELTFAQKWVTKAIGLYLPK